MHEDIDKFACQLMAFIQNPNESEDWDFNGMALSLFKFQFEHVLPYRRLCESRKATPQTVTTWTEIPCFPTSIFKEFEVTSLEPEARRSWFLSSGTTAQRSSKNFHSELSLKVYESSLLSWFKSRVLGNGLRMVSLTPTKEQAPHSSLVFMFDAFRHLFEESTFLGKMDVSGTWDLKYPVVVEYLKKCKDRPVFLVGTAFLHVLLLDWMEQNKISLRLPKGSMVLETGGYKGHVRHIAKSELYEKIRQFLGIEPNSIICEYGMCELSSQAYSLSHGEHEAKDRVRGNRSPGSGELSLETTRCFQFPPWARVQIVSPETGNEVAIGETGLIRVFDLANIHSVMAIQTEDLGIRRTDGFNLLGRNTTAEPRGCSLMSAD